MLSVATLVMIVAGIGLVEGFNGIHYTHDGMAMFGAVLTLLLSSVLFIVGVLWWLGAFGMPEAPLLLPPWDVLVDHLRTAYGLR